MRHYSRDEWLEYIRGSAGDIQGILMEEHLLNCESCLSEYIGALKQSNPAGEAPEGLTGRIMAKVRQAEKGSVFTNERKRRLGVLTRYAAAASAALVLWYFGVFGSLVEGVSNVSAYKNGFLGIEKYSDVYLGDKIVAGINGMFDTITLKGVEFLNENKK